MLKQDVSHSFPSLCSAAKLSVSAELFGIFLTLFSENSLGL